MVAFTTSRRALGSGTAVLSAASRAAATCKVHEKQRTGGLDYVRPLVPIGWAEEEGANTKRPRGGGTLLSLCWTALLPRRSGLRRRPGAVDCAAAPRGIVKGHEGR